MSEKIEVKIPERIYRRIEILIKKRPDMGFLTVEEFIIDTILRKTE